VTEGWAGAADLPSLAPCQARGWLPGGHARAAAGSRRQESSAGRRRKARGCPCRPPPQAPATKPPRRKKQQPPCGSATVATTTITVRAGEMGWAGRRSRRGRRPPSPVTPPCSPQLSPKHPTQGAGSPGREGATGPSRPCGRPVRELCSAWHVGAITPRRHEETRSWSVGASRKAARTHLSMLARGRSAGLSLLPAGQPSNHGEKKTAFPRKSSVAHQNLSLNPVYAYTFIDSYKSIQKKIEYMQLHSISSRRHKTTVKK